MYHMIGRAFQTSVDPFLRLIVLSGRLVNDDWPLNVFGWSAVLHDATVACSYPCGKGHLRWHFEIDFSIFTSYAI